MDQDRLDDVGRLILRLLLALLLAGHGISKLVGGLGGIEDMLAGLGLPALLAWGVLIGEVLAPLLLIAGVFTRLAGAVVMVNMLFAIALVHRAELFTLNAQGGWALELQGFFLFTGLAIACLGSGRYALRPD
jgi:putative oxidoreductase